MKTNITNAQVLEQIRKYHLSKGSSSETTRVSVSIAKRFMELNGQSLTEQVDPTFFGKLAMELNEGSGIVFPTKLPSSYKGRIGALVDAYKDLTGTQELTTATNLDAANIFQIDRTFPPGRFPFDSLSDVQKGVCEATADVYQMPIELATMPALAVTGAALGKAWKLTGAVNARENFGNLYIVAGGPTSCGKGAAAQLAKPIIEASAKLAEVWTKIERPNLETRRQILALRAKHLSTCLARQSIAHDEEIALESNLQKANQELYFVKQMLGAPPAYHIGNATSEALATKFARNDDTLFALASEGGDTLRVMLGKYAKGDHADFDLWLAGYSVEPYDSDRVVRGNVSITPCLTALIFCQPSLLRELCDNQEAFERGLTGRILLFNCEADLKEDDGLERYVPAERRDVWHKLIGSLLGRRGEILGNGGPVFVRCDPEAREVFRSFHNESVNLRKGEFRDIEEQLGRWRENACRIALGLCLADDPAAVKLTGEQAQRAVDLARWGQLSALQVLDGGRAERRIACLNRLCALVREHGGTVTLRILQKSHGFPPDEVHRLVAEFPARLVLETKQNPKGGPHSHILRLARH